MNLFRVVTFFCFSSILLSSAHALETDQYITLGVELEDSGPALSEYVQQKMEEAVVDINPKLSCLDAGAKVMKTFYRPFFQLIEGWAENEGNLDIFPRDLRGKHYRRTTLFQKVAWPFFIPLARTINVNGVYFGTDKLGHFTSFGVRYLKKYQRELRRGRSPEEALRKTVGFGIFYENGLVGKLASGVFSFGDMEANFQGLQFLFSLCQEQSPYRLERNAEGSWTLNGHFDLAIYVNPDWDESYNPSGFNRSWWRGKLGVKNQMKNNCSVLKSEAAQERFTYYRQNFEKSYSQKLLEELEEMGELNVRKNQNICKVQ